MLSWYSLPGCLLQFPLPLLYMVLQVLRRRDQWKLPTWTDTWEFYIQFSSPHCFWGPPSLTKSTVQIIIINYYYYYHYILCVWIFCLHVYLCILGMPSALGSQKSMSEPPGPWIIDACELLYGWWKPNPGPPEEQQVLLTADRTFWLPNHYFFG